MNIDQLTGYRRDMLYVLSARGRASVVTVRDEIEDKHGDVIDTVGVYRALNDLEEFGLVKKFKVDGKERRFYLSDEGRRQLDDHHEWAVRCMNSVEQETL